jgi:hypothetical protein
VRDDMTVIAKNGHFEVIDEHGNVLCSGDTETEAVEAYEEIGFE